VIRSSLYGGVVNTMAYCAHNDKPTYTFVQAKYRTVSHTCTHTHTLTHARTCASTHTEHAYSVFITEVKDPFPGGVCVRDINLLGACTHERVARGLVTSRSRRQVAPLRPSLHGSGAKRRRFVRDPRGGVRRAAVEQEASLKKKTFQFCAENEVVISGRLF
jgi:hypothetical protein